MKQKFHFTVWAIFYLLFGINLLVLPNTFMSMFGCPLDEHGALIARVFGSALIGLSLLYFRLRSIAFDNKAIEAIILFGFLFNAIDIPIMAAATIDGVMNRLGWFPVMVNILISISAFWLLLHSKKRTIDVM